MGTRKSTNSGTKKKATGFTGEERAAMVERARELKAESRGAFGNCRKVVCLVIGQGNDGNQSRYLKIDRHAQSVQHSGKRCAHRNQFENPVFSMQKGLFCAGESPTQQKAVRRRFGTRTVISHKVTSSSIYRES